MQSKTIIAIEINMAKTPNQNLMDSKEPDQLNVATKSINKPFPSFNCKKGKISTSFCTFIITVKKITKANKNKYRPIIIDFTENEFKKRSIPNITNSAALIVHSIFDMSCKFAI